MTGQDRVGEEELRIYGVCLGLGEITVSPLTIQEVIFQHALGSESGTQGKPELAVWIT